jgi:hypothetical protein
MGTDWSPVNLQQFVEPLGLSGQNEGFAAL